MKAVPVFATEATLKTLREKAPGTHPLTIAQLTTGLDQIEASRATAQEALATELDRRRVLLLLFKPDEEIAVVDGTIAALHLQIERFDTAEPMILAEMRETHQATRVEEFKPYIEAYRAALIEFLPAQVKVIELRLALGAVRTAAEVAGFADWSGCMEHLPATGLPDQQSVDQFAKVARISLTSPRARQADNERYSVVFSQSYHAEAYGGFNRGEVAAFPADTAHRLVAGGTATWFDKRHTPPVA